MPATLTFPHSEPGISHRVCSVPNRRAVRHGPPPARAVAASDADAEAAPAASSTRRAVLASSLAAAVVVAPWARPPPALAFASSDKGYALNPPPGWAPSSKAGADAFFTPADGSPRGASLGVVVLPVRLRDLAGAGTLEEVGQRLVDAERAKDGTLGVALTRAEAVGGGGGGGGGGSGSVPSYRFEYVLATSRAFKTVVTATAVARGNLFIVTGMAPCAGGSKAAAAAVAGGGRLGEAGVCDAGTLEGVRAAVASFAVQP